MKELGIAISCGMLLMISTTAIAQLLPTKLQVIVRSDLGNTVEEAQVTLYKTEMDYDAGENAIQSGTTDKKGRVTFKNLTPIAYYMYVEKGEMTNIGRGIKTTKLISKKKNRLNVIIE